MDIIRYKKVKILALTLLCIWFTALKGQTIKDMDGNIYHAVTIGTQVWMAENLMTTKYRNGNSILAISDKTKWDNLTEGAYSDDNSTDIKTYGRLYNWNAVNDSRNIAPKGWHVATDSEWTILTTYLGGENVAGSKLKEKSTIHWEYANSDATNQTFFTALPGGSYWSKTGIFGVKDFGYWWTSTQKDSNKAYDRTMNSSNIYVFRYSSDKNAGFSVRCIKD